MAQHYAGALYIGERIAARGVAAANARTLRVRVRVNASGGQRKMLEVLLIEKDGLGGTAVGAQ